MSTLETSKHTAVILGGVSCPGKFSGCYHVGFCHVVVALTNISMESHNRHHLHDVTNQDGTMSCGCLNTDGITNQDGAQSHGSLHLDR